MTVQRLLSNVSFTRLWTAQTVSLTGDLLAMFAVQAAIAFRLHGSARQMTAVLFASLAPAAVLGPFAGVIADRRHPKRTMIASDVIRAGLVLLLTRTSSPAAICAVCFAMSSVSAFFAPAMAITIPAIVERGGLLTAAVVAQQSAQVARMASPGIAAAMIGAMGESACYWADSASFAISAALIAAVRYPAAAGGTERKSARELGGELRAGIRYLAREPELRFVSGWMAAGTFAVGCFGALAPLYVRDVLHAGSRMFAGIGMGISVGIVAGSAVARWMGGRRDPRRMVRAGMAVAGAAMLAIAADPGSAGRGWPDARAVTLASSVAMGAGMAMVLAAATVLVQGRTPEGLRGRVSSATGAMMAMAQMAALIAAGSWGERAGPRLVFAGSSVVLLAPLAEGLLARPGGRARTRASPFARR